MLVVLKLSILASEKEWFYEGKMKDLVRIVGQVLQN